MQVLLFNSGTEDTGTYGAFTGFGIEGNQFGTSKPSSFKGFLVNSNVSQVSDDVTGLEINLDNNLVGQNFSIKTAAAPNFFADNTYINGTTTGEHS